MPRRAPEGLSGIARRGDVGRAYPAFSGMHRVLRRDWEAPSENPVQT